tara:strand:- start:118 stop:339 length:222 start_codon:yes stop_codon:yes gene_type:complete
MEQATESLLGVREVAQRLGIKDRTVYTLAQVSLEDPNDPHGLPFMFKVGGSWRARSQDVEAWIEKQATCKTVY